MADWGHIFGRIGNKPRLRCCEHATHPANDRQIVQAATCQGDRWVSDDDEADPVRQSADRASDGAEPGDDAAQAAKAAAELAIPVMCWRPGIALRAQSRSIPI